MKMNKFQRRVGDWVVGCFGLKVAFNVDERNYRFLEELLELVQACGCTKDEAKQLVDYVYDRPSGVRGQEVGGVMVTLAALCEANHINLDLEAQVELDRILRPEVILTIQRKQASKKIVG